MALTLGLAGMVSSAVTDPIVPNESDIDGIRLLNSSFILVEDPSGLTLHHENPDWLWTVSDASGGDVYVINTDGQLIMQLGYAGDDLEGITYDAGTGTLWVLEERLREMVQLTLQGQVLQRVSLDIGQENPNDGPEGIAIDPDNGHFYVANEKNPMVILELDTSLEIIRNTPIDFQAPYDVTDISGLYFEPLRRELWILSDESRKIVVADAEFNPIRYYDLSMIDKPEGIAVDLERRRVYIVSDEDDRLYTFELFSEMNPEAHVLMSNDYLFDNWPDDAPAGTFPASMVFQQSDRDDPRLRDEMNSPYRLSETDYHSDDAASIGFPYRLTRRTRINGLGERGISMINTGQGRDLGAVVLALDTRGVEAAEVSWTAGTEQANSRMYGIQLQYRTGTDKDFVDFVDDQGDLVRYLRSDVNGHEQHFEAIPLPEELLDLAYVQLRWKYYYLGLGPTSGPRDELRIGKIQVTDKTSTSVQNTMREPNAHDDEQPTGIKLLPNFPNPFNPSTTIPFEVRTNTFVNISIYSPDGRYITTVWDALTSAGTHHVSFNARNLSSGLYIYKLSSDNKIIVRSMMLIR